jgi:hypothetical protein
LRNSTEGLPFLGKLKVNDRIGYSAKKIRDWWWRKEE